MEDYNLEAFYQEMGSKIKSAREAIEMKQETLASYLGLTRASVINVEKGRHRLSIHSLLSIAKLLSIPFVNLLPELTVKDSENVKELVKDPKNVVSESPPNKKEQKILANFINSLEKK